MKPRFETLKELQLVGVRLPMSFASDKTATLWRQFSPRKNEITTQSGTDLYSVSIYPSVDFFTRYNPTTTFEKWAAVAVLNYEQLPTGMEPLVIPAGEYAVFHYVGKPSEAAATFQYIFTTWLPHAEVDLDDRPHFALMGEKYKGEDPDSEEEFWVPIKRKS